MRLYSSILVAGLALARPLVAQDSAQPVRHYPQRPSAPAAGVHAEYDSQYDKTVLQLDPTPLDSTLRLSALVALDGRDVRKEADGVVLTFWSTSLERRFQEHRGVTIALDGGGPTSLGAAWVQPNPRDGFSEVLMKSLSVDQWLALASARTATITLGDKSYSLQPLLAAIRDFASRMAPRRQ
jgi:hypothetical protein